MDSRPSSREAEAAGRVARLKTSLERARARMRGDRRLAVVTLFSFSSFAIIGPFAVYRITTGDWSIVIADALILSAFAAFTVLAWEYNKVLLAANLYAATASLAGLVTVLLLGVSPVWIFGLLVANFLMADTRIAAIVSTIVIGFIALHPDTFYTLADYFAFLAVAVMVSLFSLIFATRVDSQHRQLTHLAARDGLTGAFNRRSLDEDLALLTRSGQAESDLSLALIDLDDFKRFNDEHGHDLGDRILVDLTAIVSSTTREKDRFYRYGGDEFILLMPRTDESGAEVAMKNLCREVSERLECPSGRVRMSTGVAKFRDGESVEEWLGRADRALLNAKRSGKGRIETG